jgi:hypothetical protein
MTKLNAKQAHRPDITKMNTCVAGIQTLAHGRQGNYDICPKSVHLQSLHIGTIVQSKVKSPAAGYGPGRTGARPPD